MGVNLEIGTPALMPELVARLAANGCVTRRVGRHGCHISHPSALDAAEELAEVRFFLRAWQASLGGVALTLESDGDGPDADAEGPDADAA